MRILILVEESGVNQHAELSHLVLGKGAKGVTAFDGALSYSRPSTKGLSLSSIASLLMTVPKSRCSLFSFVIV